MENNRDLKLGCPACRGRVLTDEETFVNGYICPHCQAGVQGGAAIRIDSAESDRAAALSAGMGSSGPPPLPSSAGGAEPQPTSDHEPDGASQASIATSASHGRRIKKNNLFLIFGRRILRSDFYVESATIEERAALREADPPIHSPFIQNFVAWRRALLWFSWISASFLCVEQFGRLQSLSDDLDFFENGFLLGLLSAQVGAAVLMFMAATKWHSMVDTRKWARWAYFILLFGPFLIYLIPWRYLTHTSPEFFVTSAIMMLFPKIFGLFPGIIRACLTMKTFVPESILPGWLAVVIAPIYSLFFGIVVLAVVQGGTMLLFISFAAFMIAPLVVVKSSKALVSPQSPEKARDIVTGIRKKIGIIYVVGMIALLIAISSWFDEMDLTVWSVISFMANLVTSVSLTTVVFSDLTLGFMKAARDQEIALRNTSSEDRLQARLGDLESLGMTTMLAGEDEMARKVEAGVRQVASRGKKLLEKSGE